ncbi:DUF2958 domain-containing protein, partial [Nitrosomonas marina]
MSESIYHVITPAGVFDAIYDDEESPAKYQGDELAISFFKNWVEINQISGEHGHLLDSNNIQPFELYGFCQPAGSGIIVIPPFDDLVAVMVEDSLEEQDSGEQAGMDITYDAVGGTEKLELVRELGKVRSSIESATSGMEKLKLVKRVKEIRELLKVSSIMDPQPDPQSEETKNTLADVNAVMPLLKQFIGKSQLAAFASGIRGEEGQFIKDKLIEIANIIKNMPQTYGQDGLGDEAVVHLHYFKGSADWYITEKDMEDEQLQAFGLADLYGDGGELGYISIQELIDT